MFAVPGWSVSSSALKTQIVPAKPPIQYNPKQQDAAQPGDEDGESKKRKRGGSGKLQATEVNKSNLADMWETVIEGKPKKKKKKKKEITEEDGKGAGQPQKGHDTLSDTPDSSAISRSFDVNEATKTSKKKRKEKKQEEKTQQDVASVADPQINSSTPTPLPATPPAPPVTKLTPLQVSMRQKLISARFRHLNQTLYTTPSAQSLSLFQENPEMFTEYHEGFRRQVEVWPENPVDGYINTIKERGKLRGPSSGHGKKGNTPEERAAGPGADPLPRTQSTCSIADLGCGDAAISTALQPFLKSLHLKIHSFDLAPASPLVTRADISSLPLTDSSIDVAIFCLALMGTNWIDFIEEAFRILRWKGELWIAEIKSRFGRVGGGGKQAVVAHSVGNRKKTSAAETKEQQKSRKRKEEEGHDEIAAVEVDGQVRVEETDVSAFVEVLRKRGFVLKGEGKAGGKDEGVDLRNKMFVKMVFIKGSLPAKGKGVPVPKGMEAATGEGTWKRKTKGAKFLDDGENEEMIGSEAKVLKPCVYKLR